MWPGFSNCVLDAIFPKLGKKPDFCVLGGKRNLVGDRRKSPVCGWIKHTLQGFGNTQHPAFLQPLLGLKIHRKYFKILTLIP